MFKAKNNLLPFNIQKLFTGKNKTFGTRFLENFQQVLVRTSLKAMCLSVKGVKIWNGLFLELKKCGSVDKFKKKFKSDFFHKNSQL